MTASILRNAEISALIDRLATSFARRFRSSAFDVDDLRSVAWLAVYRLRSERETEPSLSLLRSAIWRDFLDLARREGRRRTVPLRDDEI